MLQMINISAGVSPQNLAISSQSVDLEKWPGYFSPTKEKGRKKVERWRRNRALHHPSHRIYTRAFISVAAFHFSKSIKRCDLFPLNAQRKKITFHFTAFFSLSMWSLFSFILFYSSRSSPTLSISPNWYKLECQTLWRQIADVLLFFQSLSSSRFVPRCIRERERSCQIEKRGNTHVNLKGRKMKSKKKSFFSSFCWKKRRRCWSCNIIGRFSKEKPGGGRTRQETLKSEVFHHHGAWRWRRKMERNK